MTSKPQKCGIFRGMTDFVKMWLLLRGLSDQARYTASTTEDLEQQYGKGSRPYIDRNQFAIAMSNSSLWFFFLPRIARLRIRKESIVNTDDKTRDKVKLSEIHELIDCAEPEYVYQSKEAKDNNDVYAIKLTSKNDRPDDRSYGVRFITISGGIEDFVKKFPITWSVLLIILSPKWLPLLAGFICKYAPMLKLCHV